MLIVLSVVTSSAECERDEECPDPEKCFSGSCIDACLLDTCGTFATCTSGNHRGQCSCPHGYEGDPYQACFPRKFIIYNPSQRLL